MTIRRYRQALHHRMSDHRPRAGDTVVGIRIDGGPDHVLAFCLVFDSSDLVGCWPHDSPRATVRLSVPLSAADDVVSRATTGSAALMSSRVLVGGDRSVLRRLAGAATAPGFRSYVASVSDVFGSGGPARLGSGAGPEVVAVLGAPNDRSGAVSRVAMDRCTAAVDRCRRSPAAGLVLAGGFGAQFNTTDVPHWKHCERWIARQLGADQRIVGCLESRHTYEDVLLLREMVRSLGSPSVTVVTSDYHVPRVRFLLDLVLPDASIQIVTHDGLGADEWERFRRHEEAALAQTVAATLLFGVDRLPAGLSQVPEGGKRILRLPRQ